MFTELTDDQKEAAKLIGDWFKKSSGQFFVLAGYAGTGKTTLVKKAVEDLKLKAGVSAVFVTPTGKAATVLIKNGVPATTLHKLIYQSTVEEREIEINGKKVRIEKLIFRRRESIDKQIRLIVVDEASMVSDEVLFDIARFDVKILLCGDNAQLPPVEGFNTPLQKPDFTLKTIVRQQWDNPIIRLSELARLNSAIKYGRYGDSVMVLPKREFFGEKRKNYLLRADQIICGTNRTRAEINDEVRRFYKRSGLPSNGEKLICTQNNWEQFIDADEKFNLVNGIIGYAYDPFYDVEKGVGFMRFQPEFLNGFCPDALPFDLGVFLNGNYLYKHGEYIEKTDDGGNVVGAFGLNRFEYGYCISCHKAQGSEFDNLIVFDESYAFREDRNRWLYTAVTRAKKKLILLR